MQLDGEPAHVKLLPDYSNIEVAFGAPSGYVMPTFEALSVIQIKVYNYHEPSNYKIHSFKIRELDCSVRFSENKENLVLSPIPLNSRWSSNYVIPVAKDTPQACIDNFSWNEFFIDSGESGPKNVDNQNWAS